MAVLSAGVALPLLAVGVIQAIIRQEPGGLLRSALVRLPLALLFTGVSVQLVALGLAATDQASVMVLGAAGDPTHRLLLGLVTGLEQTGGPGLAAFGAFLVVLTAAVVAFVLWLELAVRSAAIAAASLFLPLALVGLAWPATSHWALPAGRDPCRPRAFEARHRVGAGACRGVVGKLQWRRGRRRRRSPARCSGLRPVCPTEACSSGRGWRGRPSGGSRSAAGSCWSALGHGVGRSGDRRGWGPRRPCSARLQGREQHGRRRFEPADHRLRRRGAFHRGPADRRRRVSLRFRLHRFRLHRFRLHRPLGLVRSLRFFCHTRPRRSA